MLSLLHIVLGGCQQCFQFIVINTEEGVSLRFYGRLPLIGISALYLLVPGQVLEDPDLLVLLAPLCCILDRFLHPLIDISKLRAELLFILSAVFLKVLQLLDLPLAPVEPLVFLLLQMPAKVPHHGVDQFVLDPCKGQFNAIIFKCHCSRPLFPGFAAYSCSV